MSLIGLRFSRALEKGRNAPSSPLSREDVLVSLLNKRAVAARMGADEIEAMLRAQIIWSLPMVDQADAPGELVD